MTSREINDLVKDGDKGIKELYKVHSRYFELVDQWSEKLTNGDLLNEFEIAESMERLTGCMMKFGVVAGALEAIKEAIEQDARVKGFSEAEKLNAPAVDVIKAKARVAINGIRKNCSDFRNYFYAAQSGVTTAQSRLKRLTVTKGAKGIGWIGEAPVEEEKAKLTDLQKRVLKEGETTSNSTEEKPNKW